jgi:hypothetical protein
MASNLARATDEPCPFGPDVGRRFSPPDQKADAEVSETGIRV